jgi:IS4 transposase
VCLSNGSGVSREVHAPFYEGLAGKFRWSTHHENGSTGILYLISNDMLSSAERLYEVYQKRWRIEEYHKSMKQNASLTKSPTRTVKTQCNHIDASIIAYCKLEMLKTKTQLNHFTN